MWLSIPRTFPIAGMYIIRPFLRAYDSVALFLESVDSRSPEPNYICLNSGINFTIDPFYVYIADRPKFAQLLRLLSRKATNPSYFASFDRPPPRNARVFSRRSMQMMFTALIVQKN